MTLVKWRTDSAKIDLILAFDFAGEIKQQIFAKNCTLAFFCLANKVW
jgi:hypothetical protein